MGSSLIKLDSKAAPIVINLNLASKVPKSLIDCIQRHEQVCPPPLRLYVLGSLLHLEIDLQQEHSDVSFCN